MGVRYSVSGSLRKVASLLSGAAILLAVVPGASASPDCSNAGLHPSDECAVKLDYCNHTSIVVVLAVRGREAGMTESDNFAKLASNATHEAWYEKYREIVKSIVHQIYTNESAYQKLRERIGPSMALAIPALTAGCSADASVSVDTR